jgi:hypothetical protein
VCATDFVPFHLNLVSHAGGAIYEGTRAQGGLVTGPSGGVVKTMLGPMVVARCDLDVCVWRGVWALLLVYKRINVSQHNPAPCLVRRQAVVLATHSPINRDQLWVHNRQLAYKYYLLAIEVTTRASWFIKLNTHYQDAKCQLI